jgi:ATP-binding cassette, subfamily D (ALD), member 3
MIAIPASFVNSFLEFLNKRLSLNFKQRLTNYFHSTYLKDMVFYQLGNLDSRVTNPDQRLTADIEKWATSLSTIYSNFSKPALDILLFSRKLSELVGWQGPMAIVLWYLCSGTLLRVVSPPFGKLTAVEQRLEGDYRASQTDLVHHAEEVAFFRGNEWEKTRINNQFNVNFIVYSRN